jgi:serine phosphatase RsbU (regulator of sigma subunit)
MNAEKAMKRLTVFLLLNFIITGLSAQINKYGTPVSKSFSMQVTNQGAEQNWSIVKDIFGAVYFGNDNNMVVRYDGTKWTTIPLNKDNQTTARALGSDENGIIYVGGTNEFGYIEPDSTGRRVYRSMTNRITSAKDISGTIQYDTTLAIAVSVSEITIGDLQSVVIKDSKVYFLSGGLLIIYNTLDDSLSYVNMRKLGLRQFVRMFLINNKIILANNILGLMEFDDNKLIQLRGGDFFKFKKSMTVLPLKDEKLIVGTLDHGIFLLDYSTGTVDSNFIDRKLITKLKEFRVYSGVKLHSGEIVFGTIGDGAYVFNEDGDCIGHFTSANTEMLDNSISAMYSDPDKNSELWISATGSITKVYVNLPFTQFSEKSGINGSVNNFCSFNGSVFVATDLGLFKSTTDKDGHRIFRQVNDISSQIFSLEVCEVAADSFLLAGSNFESVYQVFPDGKSVLLSVTRDPTRTIFQSKIKKSRFFIGLSNDNKIYIVDYRSGQWDLYGIIKGLPGLTLSCGELDNGDLLLLTSYPDGLFKVPVNDSIPIPYTVEKGIPESGLNNLNEDNRDFILSTTRGLFKLNKTNDTWEPCDDITGGYTKNRSIDAFYRTRQGNIWISTSEERYYDIMFSDDKDTIAMIKGGALSIIPSLKYLAVSSIEGRVWLTKSKNIYIIDYTKLNAELPSVQTLLTKIVVSSHGADSLIMNETFYKVGANGKRYPVSSNTGQKAPEFKYKLNSPSFFWTTPYMIQEEETLYSFKLEGFDDDWSNWSKISYKDYTNLSFGKYTFKLKAKTATEIESKEASYNFVILKPWYLTPGMIILYAIATILSIFGIIMAYTKSLKNENIRLEGIVKERTAIVVKQKEELESSIHYASRIQMALLPSEAILSENIKNYFVLFKPRDIVSGDFYWMTKKDNRLYIVASDCTGHGVPGAFMSLLGMSFLDEIIDKETAPRADFILNELRHHVTDSLKQVGQDDEAKDGMDIALLVIDFNKQRIEFSGAYNPCFRVRKLAENEAAKYEDDSTEKPDGTMTNGKYLLETIYASKMPIGISSRMNEDFVFYDWILEKGISYYLFSDGYIDQFGGEQGRKFMKKNFKRLILEIQDYPMSKQKELLEKSLMDWMGQSPQIDDILVMGLRTE